mgnify:CR=1 FL=1
MNVGIIVYSQSGNTLSVAQKLEKVIKSAGHTVSIARIEPVSVGVHSPLKSAPDIIPYDAVIFASPVQAFSLAPVMKMYLSQISDLSGKQASCFVTQHFKKRFLGGNRAIRQITAACKAKGAEVSWSGVVNWSSDIREKQIDDIVTRLSSIYGKSEAHQ